MACGYIIATPQKMRAESFTINHAFDTHQSVQANRRATEIYPVGYVYNTI